MLSVLREDKFQGSCVRLEGGNEKEGGFIRSLQKILHIHRCGYDREVVLAALFAGFEGDGVPFFALLCGFIRIELNDGAVGQDGNEL